MIIKRRDTKTASIKDLNALLELPLPDNKKFLVEKELRLIKSGERGEKDAAYFIDFHFAPSERWAVIHDLRLEHKGRVAQIDHLLINRLFDIYILESKYFSYGVKITETGEFLVQDGIQYMAIESPIEQNKRHRIVLEEVIRNSDIMPRRLGITIRPSFHCYILVSPRSRVVRPTRKRFDTSMVIKADSLTTAIDERVDKITDISVWTSGVKISSFEKVLEVAEGLASLHRPLKIDYTKRFGIEVSPYSKSEEKIGAVVNSSNHFYCFKCKMTITQKVARFCWDNSQRFGGRAYCFDCQKQF
jgi:hypothetical protein